MCLFTAGIPTYKRARADRTQNSQSGEVCPQYDAGVLGGTEVAPASKRVCIVGFGRFTFPEAIRPLFWPATPRSWGVGEARGARPSRSGIQLAL